MRYSGSSPRLPRRLQDILLPATAGISDEWLVELDMQEERDGLKTGNANEVLERATKGATSARHCLATGSVISTMAWGSGVATAFGPIRPSGRLTITRWVAEEEEAEGFAPSLLEPSPLAPTSPFVVMLELAVGGASRLASLELASRWRSPPCAAPPAGQLSGWRAQNWVTAAARQSVQGVSLSLGAEWSCPQQTPLPPPSSNFHLLEADPRPATHRPPILKYTKL